MPSSASVPVQANMPAQANMPGQANIPVSSNAPVPTGAPAPIGNAQGAPQAQLSNAPKSKKRWKLPVIIGGAAAVVIVVVLIAIFGIGGMASPPPQEAVEAINDAQALADDLVKRYEGYRAAAESGDAQNSGSKSATGGTTAKATDSNNATVANEVAGSDKLVGDEVGTNGEIASGDGSGSADQGNADDDVKAAGESGASNGTGGSTSADSSGGKSYDENSAEINAMLERVRADMSALEAKAKSWKGYDQALASMKNLEGALQYELDVLEVHHNAAMAGQGTGAKTALQSIKALEEGYAKITPPQCLEGYLKNTLDTLPTIEAALLYNAKAPNSTLSQYTSQELIAWWITKQSAYDAENNEILVHQCKASSEQLKDLAQGKTSNRKPSAEMSVIDEIAPNMYPSLDAVTNIGVTSYDDKHSVMVEVEVAGLSQKHEQKFDLAQGYNYLSIKPALLPASELPNLENNSTTQVNVKVTDASSGEVIAQESHPISLLSIYDFTWTNDEFGATAAFDIMAWLRPQCEEVNAINRAAADVLGKWSGGKYQSLAGYQYGDNALMTLAQVAAIQQAISDAGVVYVMDSYSFTSNQHVLTPDAVVKKKQGLCIETTLLMASCLMSAGMHPLIIITPTHAQIAVETYEGSGKYFLIETTVLPYAGLNTKTKDTDPAFYNGLLAGSKTKSGGIHYWTTSGSSEEWQQYFEYTKDGSGGLGGNFVIDCRLQPVMGIQGLENVQTSE